MTLLGFASFKPWDLFCGLPLFLRVLHFPFRSVPVRVRVRLRVENIETTTEKYLAFGTTPTHFFGPVFVEKENKYLMYSFLC